MFFQPHWAGTDTDLRWGHTQSLENPEGHIHKLQEEEQRLGWWQEQNITPVSPQTLPNPFPTLALKIPV